MGVNPDSDVVVTWRDGIHNFRQKLPIPERWRPLGNNYVQGEPSVLFWGSRPENVKIVVLCNDSYGMSWDYKAPIIFQRQGKLWKSISLDPDRFSFSDEGSFYCSGNNLIKWNIGFADNTGHRDPQHVTLQVFRLQGRHLQLARSMTTKYRHDVNGYLWGSAKRRKSIPDPLAEFGYHWRGWAHQ